MGAYNLTEQFQATYEPFAFGLGSPEHMAAGFYLTGGLAFPYPDGAIVLRRRTLYPTPGEWVDVGVADVDELQIANTLAAPHAADQGYHYTAAYVLGNGFASSWADPVRLDFDNLGALIAAGVPAEPIDVAASRIAGGAFVVSWQYSPFGQGTDPADFQVFAGATAATIDYGTPLVDAITGLNYTTYAPGVPVFEFTSAGFADGTPKSFAVRSRSAAGVAELHESGTPVLLAAAAVPDDAGGVAALPVRG